MPFYLNDVGVRAELLAWKPLSRGRDVAGQPHLVLEVQALWRSMLWVSPARALEFMLLGRKDFGPPVC